MIKLHPVKDGPRPNNTFTHIEITIHILDEIREKIDLKYIGEDPPLFHVEFPSDYAEHLVLEIEKNEIENMKNGFYKLDIHPRDINKIIPSL